MPHLEARNQRQRRKDSSAKRHALFESLPVELIAEILSELDLESLATVSCLSKRLRSIAGDPTLNPWKRAIARNLRRRDGDYEPCLAHLSERSTFPRTNWLDVLSSARPDFILFEATLPNLLDSDYAEAFSRRFLPSWDKWRKDGCRWREAYRKILYRVWHRSTTTCTADEAWTKYIVLNRNGSVNLLETSSRNFNPQLLFNEMKIQNNLAHLETHIRLVVELADVRILAFGVLTKPRSPFSINENARILLHPLGIHRGDSDETASLSETSSLHSSRFSFTKSNANYEPLTHPQPSPGHANYPFFTPGGEDKRWTGSGLEEEKGNLWVGGLLLCAQLCTQETRMRTGERPMLQDLDLVIGPGRNKYVSMGWPDLDAIAPWLAQRITKRINGQGLGL